MGPRQRRNALAQCLLQLLHRVCGPRAERYQAAGQREEILDPMIHLAHQQGLAFLRFRSEEHTSELQSLMRISYAVFCLKKQKTTTIITHYAIRKPLRMYVTQI